MQYELRVTTESKVDNQNADHNRNRNSKTNTNFDLNERNRIAAKGRAYPEASSEENRNLNRPVTYNAV